MSAVSQLSSSDRMALLCDTFPTLSRAEGVQPFDPEAFDAWACGPVPCHGATYAARFVLAVWSGRTGKVGKPRRRESWDGEWRFPVDLPWRCGPFDIIDALSTWDGVHRAAFVAWARDPWWP
jgi:hypothetical protein